MRTIAIYVLFTFGAVVGGLGDIVMHKPTETHNTVLGTYLMVLAIGSKLIFGDRHV